MFRPGTPEAVSQRALLDRELHDTGRDPSTFGVEGWVNYDPARPDRWRPEIDAWANWGASHVSIRTFDVGLASPGEHIQALRTYMERVSGEGS